jgi:hypothetical protein
MTDLSKIDLQKIVNDVKTKVTTLLGALQKEVEKYTKGSGAAKPQDSDKPKETSTENKEAK